MRALTNRIHRVWRKLEHTIEDKGTPLEEHISPVPAVILDHVMGLGLDPKVEGNKRNAADPSK